MSYLRGFAVFVGLVLLSPSSWADPVTTSTLSADEAEVEVDFVGDDEVVGDEIEEIDWDDLSDTPPLPEYDSRPWLTALPVACVALLAWNVRWRPGRRRTTRRKNK